MHNEEASIPLLQRLECLFKTVIGQQELYVPVRDESLYAILQQETSYIAVQHEDADLLVLMDDATADEIANREAIFEKARTIVLIDSGKAVSWESPKNLIRLSVSPSLHRNDRVLQSVSLWCANMSVFPRTLPKKSFREDGLCNAQR